MSSLKHAIDTLVEIYPTMIAQPKRLVPMLLGAPGLGKSQAVYQAAEIIREQNNIEPEDFSVVELRAGTMDPAEIGGFRFVIDGKTEVTEPDWYPKTQHGLLFLDELAQASLAGMNALSEVMLDHRIGTRSLPAGWMVVSASNRKQDRAGTNKIPSHIQDRILPLDITLEVEALQDYAIRSNWYDLVPVYWNYRPENVHNLGDDGRGATPRSWEMVSNFKRADLSPQVDHTMVLSALGEEVGSDFLAFERTVDLLPDIDDLINDPMNAKVDHKPDIMYALMGALATNMARHPAKVAGVIQYLDRIDQEWAFTCIADAERFNSAARETDPTVKQLASSKAYTDWLSKHKDVFVGA